MSVLVAAVVEVDLVPYGKLKIEPGVGVIPGIGVGIGLEKRLQVADPVHPVPGPGQRRVSHAKSALGRFGRLPVVVQDLDQADQQVAALEVAVHAVELDLALVGAVVGGEHVPGLLPVDQVTAGGMHRGAAEPGPCGPGRVDRDRRQVSIPPRVAKDVVDVVVVAHDRIGSEHRPFQPAGRDGDLQAALAPPSQLEAFVGFREARTFVDHRTAEIDRARILQDPVRTNPMDAVLRLQVGEPGRAVLVLLLVDVVPDAEAARPRLTQHRHVGCHAVVLFSRD